jgi:hypothetical protein
LNLLVFLAIWAIIWYIPIPLTKFKPLSIRRLASLAVGLVLFGFNILVQTPLSSFVYLLFFSRFAVAFFEYFVSMKLFKVEQFDNSFRSGQFPQFQFKLKQKRALLGIVLVAIFLVSVAGLTVFGEVQRVANANYFDGFIQQGSGLPFSSTIPDNMVRLVTQELAVSIARRHMSEFGSNTQVLDCHVTKSLEDKLVWVATIGSTNIISENYIKGFVVVDANDPAAPPKIVHTQFNVGEGLWWDRNIPFRNYIDDISKTYGVAYPTWSLDTNTSIYVVTSYNLGFDFVRRYETPLAYDSQGKLEYEPKSMSEIPAWMTQVYDEDWLETMINEYGGFRRGSGFDYFAGGFLWIVPPSQDRFQMTEDTRYIIDPQTKDVVALVCVNPAENQRTLSGVFKATREGVLFYNLKQSNYISGMTAEDLVEGRLPKPATGDYYAVMPLLYTIEVAPGNNRLAWYVPIYWNEGTGESDETIYLAGFAIVDAQDTNKIASTINQEGITSQQLVQQTRLEYTRLFGVNVTMDIRVTANVLNTYEYVQDGSTHIILHLNNTTYPWIEATPKDLSAQQWNELISTQPEQKIFAQIEKRDDRWMMTDFSNQNLH